MHRFSDLIRLCKEDHIRQTGKIPAHVYIPLYVYNTLQDEVARLNHTIGVDLEDATLTHIHGMEIHELACLDHTDIVCSVTEEPA